RGIGLIRLGGEPGGELGETSFLISVSQILREHTVTATHNSSGVQRVGKTNAWRNIVEIRTVSQYASIRRVFYQRQVDRSWRYLCDIGDADLAGFEIE